MPGLENVPNGSSQRPRAYSLLKRLQMSELAVRYRLPAMYPYTIQVADAGGLMAERRAATYIDKVLKGAKPSARPLTFRQGGSRFPHMRGRASGTSST